MTVFCGSARVDTTPAADLLETGGVFTAGFWHERFLPMTAVRDPISARVCFLREDAREVALVSWESLGDAVGMTARVRAYLEAAGAGGVRIFLASTHSHTAPDTIGLNTCAQPERYLVGVAERIANAVLDARGKAEPAATMGISLVRVPDLAVNRRPILRNGRLAVLESSPTPSEIADPGKVDDDLAVVCIADVSGRTLARIVHWACHPVSMQAQPAISPGFPGFLSRQFEEEDGSASTLFFNGACGDINPAKMGRREDAEELAHELSRRASEALREDVSLSAACALDFAEETVDILRRTDTEPPAADGAGGEAPGAGVRRDDAEWRHSGAGWRAFVARQARRVAAMSAVLDVPVCVARVGPVVFAGVGGELFAEGGIGLRQAGRPRIVLPVSYVNGYCGYLAPRDAYAQGGYETECAPWCPLAPGEAERVVDACAQLIRGPREDRGGGARD